MLSRRDSEKLDIPHLAAWLPDDFFELNEADRKREERKAILAAAHLPASYDKLTKDKKKRARKAVLTSWFDPKKPGVLCNNVENLIAAHFLWVEFYMKPDKYTQGQYFFRDAITKYDMVRACMSPPILEDHPAKTAIHCPRSTTKTKTIIHELCPMMAINRPYTKILVAEINKDRTTDELQVIRLIIENNKLIQEDFGGKGVLYQTSLKSALKWNDSQLDFALHPWCSIQGYSAKSKQRGRHPIFGVIDDGEDEDTVTKRDFRRQFFRNLLNRFLGMFYPGSKFVVIGTVIRNSCLQIMLQDLIETPVDTEDAEENYDERFEDWHKIHFGMIEKDKETGERYSIMPDHTSVEAYDEKIRTMGAAVVAAELDGRPIAEGLYALIRDEHRHGYMHCLRQGSNVGLPEEYMLDLLTGEIVPWETFLEMLCTTGGCDIADSMARDASFGANVVVGFNPDRVVFVLDCYAKRTIADDWPELAFGMCHVWDVTRQAFDTAAMQKVVYRMAERLKRELESQDRTMPVLVPVSNAGQNKHLRVLATLRPLYRKHYIRFPVFTTVRTPDGRIHTPAPHPNRRHFRELLRELDTYTDEGPSGHDDVADALQMAIKIGGGMHGSKPEVRDAIELQLEKWRKAGIDWESRPHLVPPEAWTDGMRERMEPEPELAEAETADVDPYAYC